jgi:DNA uptake protein ComE-like DNA-binding protein
MLALTCTLMITSTALSQVGKNKNILNPNRAGQDELLKLPQVTPEFAKQLIAERPFLSMAAFDTFANGKIADEHKKELYKKLFVPINLNTATRKEILLVPGVGRRMAHEFEEYRPYKAMAQFRREIGKYVDTDEVARMEQYVFVPIELNTASDKDILSIPGVGKRMLHEFTEYRPYKNMEQFKREIGKYVDKKELARLERYVTLDKPVEPGS